MTTTSYEIRARKFAHQIYPYVTNCRKVSDYERAIWRFNVEHHRHVRVAHGQTRIALITSDYVLKIDYGRLQWKFGGCADERRAYQKVWKDGYAHLFAKITPFMVNEIVFYIMPRIKYVGEEYNGWDDVYETHGLTEEESDYLSENFYDLHQENYGHMNGRVVVVDYAFSSRVYDVRHA